VDTAERRRFAEDGYVVLSGRAEPRWFDALAEAVESRVATAGLGGRAGSFSLDLSMAEDAEPFEALHQSSVWRELQDLVAPAELEHFDGVAQITVNTPPNDVEPVEPHVDHHRRGADRPDSFSLLVAVLLTDQVEPNEGNVWVWPGTHLLHGEYLAAYGPRALLAGAGKLKQVAAAVRLPRPVSVCGSRGDVLVAHPLLGHETGPNHGDRGRRALYFRLRRSDHEARWEECLTDPLLEYNPALH
jgi:ectoine hydroxylase-related dioxygenase (phytanoyl-CoA dioxygenase family)